MLLAESFVNEVVQELVLALGLALALGNVIALVANRRRQSRYAAELAEWEAERARARKAAKHAKSKGKKGPGKTGGTGAVLGANAASGVGPAATVVVGPKPEQPERARVGPAVVMIVVGLGMSIWGIASLLA